MKRVFRFPVLWLGVAMLGACGGSPTGARANIPATLEIGSPGGRDFSATPGVTVQLHATVLDSAGDVLTGVPVAWSSSDTARAQVDTAGVVTTRASGEAFIRADVSGNGYALEDSLEVIVAPLTSGTRQG